MPTGADRTRNNGILILLKVTKASSRGTCPQNKPTYKKPQKNNTEGREGRRKVVMPTNELIPFGISKWWPKLIKQGTMA